MEWKELENEMCEDSTAEPYTPQLNPSEFNNNVEAQL